MSLSRLVLSIIFTCTFICWFSLKYHYYSIIIVVLLQSYGFSDSRSRFVTRCVLIVKRRRRFRMEFETKPYWNARRSKNVIQLLVAEHEGNIYSFTFNSIFVYYLLGRFGYKHNGTYYSSGSIRISLFCGVPNTIL